MELACGCSSFRIQLAPLPRELLASHLHLGISESKYLIHCSSLCCSVPLATFSVEASGVTNTHICLQICVAHPSHRESQLREKILLVIPFYIKVSSVWVLSTHSFFSSSHFAIFQHLGTRSQERLYLYCSPSFQNT